MTTLLVLRERVKIVLEEQIRAGEELDGQAEIVKWTGHNDWNYLFSQWRDHTLAQLGAVYHGDDIPNEFAVVTVTREQSSPELTFPQAKASLGRGLFILQELVNRLPLAVEPDAVRIEVLTADEAALTTAAFEAPFRRLVLLAQEGIFAADDEEFVRRTMQQITSWRQRDDAKPQEFELLVAGIIKRLFTLLADTSALERALNEFGVDDTRTRLVAESVTGSIHTMTELGDLDPVRDASALKTIAENTALIADQLKNLAPPKRTGRKLAEAAATGVATTVGKKVGEAGLDVLRNAFDEVWPDIQIGLMMAWQSVRRWFVT